MNQLQSLTKADVALGTTMLQSNFNLKPTESLLVVSDPQMENLEGQFWLQAARKMTSTANLLVINGMTENAQEPASEIGLAMTQADVVILQTTFSLSHTDARRQASKAGARIASLPGANLEMLRRTLSVDYQALKCLNEKLVAALGSRDQVMVTNPAGTNLTFSIKNQVPEADSGYFLKPGEFGNLPAGETMLAPVEGSCHGIMVVEGSFASIPTDVPIKVVVKDGFAQSITGGIAAKELDRQIKIVGDKARNIAELGVGTNPNVNPQGKILEAEKTYGTVHIALGNNKSYGGTVDVPFHSDGIILSPTLKIDGKIIIKDGKFLI